MNPPLTFWKATFAVALGVAIAALFCAICAFIIAAFVANKVSDSIEDTFGSTNETSLSVPCQMTIDAGGLGDDEECAGDDEEAIKQYRANH